MTRRKVLVGGLVGAAATVGLAVGLGTGQAVEPEERSGPLGRLTQYVVVIPQAKYQAIVISPEATGPNGSASLSFTIRTRDQTGRVSDFPFFVRGGDVRTITFPEGWAPAGESVLLAPPNASFAAWGVGMGTGPNGVPAAGPLIRFEPIYRDTQKDVRDRDREREFEELLREGERNR